MVAEPRKGRVPMGSGVSGVQSRSQNLLQACTAPQANARRRTDAPPTQFPVQMPLSSRVVPAAPVTTAKKLPLQSKAQPLTTPLTEPDSLSGTSQLPSESSTSSSLLSSNRDASSYQLSGNDDASTDSNRLLPVGKPPLPPKAALKRRTAGAEKQQTSPLPAADSVAVRGNSSSPVTSVLKVSYLLSLLCTVLLEDGLDLAATDLLKSAICKCSAFSKQASIKMSVILLLSLLQPLNV